METTTFKIVPAQSNIDWVGRKITGAHNGTINIKEGTLAFKEGQLAAGKFVIDTTSIRILDVTDPATNAQFAGHLASDDFFNSGHFPEAMLVITATKSEGNGSVYIDGDLTIKGTTHPVGFKAQISNTGTTLTASGKIVIDRTKYGMRFRSGNFFKDLGDTLIYNDFELNVHIAAQRSSEL